MISVIIPANNEAAYIGPCLDALLAQSTDREVEIIVAANACADETVALSRAYVDRARARGWYMQVLDLPQGGKPNALNRGDDAASGDMRVYLDADVVMEPDLLAQLAEALDRPGPVYASGRLLVAPARSWVTRAYARIWTRVPFMTDCVPGAGLFAVNRKGRARWGEFPQIISDDTFVRLNFTPAERIGVEAGYLWPMVEGFDALVRVRRRQDIGVSEVAELYPDLMGNEDKPKFGLARALNLALCDPVGFMIYVGVALAVRRSRGKTGDWSRGR